MTDLAEQNVVSLADWSTCFDQSEGTICLSHVVPASARKDTFLQKFEKNSQISVKMKQLIILLGLIAYVWCEATIYFQERFEGNLNTLKISCKCKCDIFFSIHKIFDNQ